MGGPCDFSVSPSPFGLDFGTLDFGTSDLGLTISINLSIICNSQRESVFSRNNVVMMKVTHLFCY